MLFIENSILLVGCQSLGFLECLIGVLLPACDCSSTMIRQNQTTNRGVITTPGLAKKLLMSLISVALSWLLVDNSVCISKENGREKIKIYNRIVFVHQ